MTTVNSYLDYLVQPYVDTMVDIHDKDTFFNWFRQVNVGNKQADFEDTFLEREDVSLRDLKDYFIDFLKEQLYLFASNENRK